MRVLLLVWLLALGAGAQELPPSRPSPLGEFFRQEQGWTGGDAAYSVELGPERLLWLFGDTFVGAIRDGRRVSPVMVHNTAAWSSPRRFFFFPDRALLEPAEPDSYYWPSHGALADGRLYLFMKKIRATAGEPGFDFDWWGDDLVEVFNPQAEPTAWQFRRHALPPDRLRPGTVCAVRDHDLLTFCLDQERRAVLARVLRNGPEPSLEYWDGESYGPDPERGEPLFAEAAPEMSLVQDGRGRWWMVYTRLGLGSDVLARHATRLEGPWSEPILLFRCPQDAPLTYGAKAHRVTPDGWLEITWCRNSGSMEEHNRRPWLYFPQAVQVRLPEVEGDP